MLAPKDKIKAGSLLSCQLGVGTTLVHPSNFFMLEGFIGQQNIPLEMVRYKEKPCYRAIRVQPKLMWMSIILLVFHHNVLNKWRKVNIFAMLFQ